jgi:hypothetical protein
MFTLFNIQLNENTYFSDKHATLHDYCNENSCIRKDRLVSGAFHIWKVWEIGHFGEHKNFKYQEFILGTSKNILKSQKLHNATAIENRAAYV